MEPPRVVSIYVLDVSYEIVGSEPHIIVWGIDEHGHRVVARDKRFRPYFYAVVDPEAQDRGLIEYIKNSIKRLSKLKSPITKVEEVDRKFLGRPVKALRVETLIPEYVREYREDVAKISGVKAVLEADIRFSLRYMIDFDIHPCTWHRFKVVERGKPVGYRADLELEILDVLDKEEGKIQPPELRLLAFDIEVYNPKGAPKPHMDPVIIISMVSSNGRVEVLQAEGKDDRRLIKEFVELVNGFDPDIIVGYNSNRFDWPYLIQRARHLGVKLDVTRKVYAEPSMSVYGHISILGRLNVDLYDFVEELTEVKVKSLDEVAEYLGVMKKSERAYVPWYEIHKYWDEPALRPTLLTYARDDAVATYGIAERFLPFAMQLSSITGLPLDQVGAASTALRLEWFLLRVARKRGELAPNRVEREYEPYKGAIVLEPKRGVHENVAVLDFSAMYPSIMIKYNIGPDTLVVGEESSCEVIRCYRAPETNYLFLSEPPAFLREALETLVEARKRVREAMRAFPADSTQYKMLDARQRALKVLANACYGYMAWTGARWFCRECAEAVADFGRESIRRVIEAAKRLGLEVIYGDTDSVFVKYDEKAIGELIKFVERELGLEIKVDKVYQRVFFTEAKKRYIGLTYDGRIDVVGFEAVRGDWAEIAKELQEKVAEAVLKTMDYRKALELVRNELINIRKGVTEGTADISKFIIWKTITKPLGEYEVEAPHVVAARTLLKMGYSIEVGDKVGYVIVRGAGKISERAKPYIAVDVREIDVDYYTDHQIIPAVLRILGYFGITEKSLKGLSRTERSLFDYAKRGG